MEAKWWVMMPVFLPERELQVIGTKKQPISYFRDKYADRVCHTIEMEGDHPFLSELKMAFERQLVSQDKAKNALSQAVLDSILRLGNPKWPLGVFFFHGPTWVGKTEIVKALSETMFWDPNGFIKINCENLAEMHSSSNLFGAPKWYIWYDDKTPFTNKNVTLAYDVAKKTGKLNPMIERLPWLNILLFDEIEKAHPEVIQQLLWLLDEGKVTTSKWEVVNFQNSIIVFTSNIGQEKITQEKNKNAIWFASSKSSKADLEKIFQASLKEIFKPEFLWRIHAFIEFEELSRNEDCIKIIDIQVKEFNEYLLKYYTESHIQFELSPELYEYILQKWFSREKWARELVRTYNDVVKRYLTRLLHSPSFKKYYEYEGKIIIGISVDREERLTFDIVLNGEKEDIKEFNIWEILSENQEMSLETLKKIYTAISAYTLLTYQCIGEDIDMSDELKIYAAKLREFWLNQTDISSLKNRAFLEWLRDLSFIQDFETMGLWSEENELFSPYEPRTLLKAIERKIEVIYRKTGKTEKRFIHKSIKDVMEMMAKFMWVDKLSGKQENKVLFYIRKTLVEKYWIRYY